VIKLDIALDELVLEPERHPLVVRWRDLADSRDVCVYSLREVCAEKLRCVIQRWQCRDAYDLWVLAEREQAVDLVDAWPAFEAKARHKQLAAGAFFDAWTRREPLYRQGWARELGAYLGSQIPPVDGVMRQLNRRIGTLRDTVGR
jgi:predicted nucleotidyltransferase component of viral defense system